MREKSFVLIIFHFINYFVRSLLFICNRLLSTFSRVLWNGCNRRKYTSQTQIADSAQTEYCFTFPCVCVCVCVCVCQLVLGVTSHISHIYKGINAMLIIRGSRKPCIFWIKIILAIFLAKTRPDKTIFSALTNLTIDFDFELSKILMLNPQCLLCLVFILVLKIGRNN